MIFLKEKKKNELFVSPVIESVGQMFKIPDFIHSLHLFGEENQFVERLFNGPTAGSEDDDDVGQQRACLCTGGLQEGSFSAVVNPTQKLVLT